MVRINADGVETFSPALRALAGYARMGSKKCHNPFGVAANVRSLPRLARWRAQAWAEGLNAFGVGTIH